MINIAQLKLITDIISFKNILVIGMIFLVANVFGMLHGLLLRTWPYHCGSEHF